MTIGEEESLKAEDARDEGAESRVAATDYARLAARADERFLDPVRGARAARARFLALVALIVLIYAGIIAALLWRDAHAPVQTAQSEETPVEIVVEKPPEPPKPQPPAKKEPPPPPKPKEDLSPARSAPRAPNEDQTKTETKEAKTAAPNKLPTPAQGQPQAAPAAAPPKEATPDETKKEEAAKEEDLTKPDAEALDKAKPKATKKEAKSKEAKAAPKVKRIPNALAALAGAPSLDATMTFAKPTPKTKIYGGTEDVRWMSEVEAMLEAKVQKLPHTAHYQTGGNVAICFHVDTTGHVIERDFCKKSGYPDIDQMAMRALLAAAPFPPPPPGLERGLIWGTTFDGQVPTLHFR